MTSDVLKSMLLQDADESFRAQFTIMSSAPPTLSQTLSALFLHDSRFKAPKQNTLSERIRVADRVCNVYYGISQTLTGIMSDSGAEESASREEEVLELHPKTQRSNRDLHLAAERSKALSEKLIRALSEKPKPDAKKVDALDADLRKLQSQESCQKLESTKKVIVKLAMEEEVQKRKQRCYVCLRTIRPRFKSDQDVCKLSPVTKAAFSPLDGAFSKCGVSMKDFVGQQHQESTSHRLRQRRRRSLLMNPSDLAVALGMSSDVKGSATAVAASTSSATGDVLQHMHNVRIQDGSIPLTCGDVSYPKSALEMMEKGAACVSAAVLSSSASTSSLSASTLSSTNIGKKECTEVVKQVHGGLTSLQKGLSAALGRQSPSFQNDVVGQARYYHRMKRYTYVDGVVRKILNHNDAYVSVISSPERIQTNRCLSDRATACCDLDLCSEEDESAMSNLMRVNEKIEQENTEAEKKQVKNKDKEKMLESPPGFGVVTTSKTTLIEVAQTIEISRSDLATAAPNDLLDYLNAQTQQQHDQNDIQSYDEKLSKQTVGSLNHHATILNRLAHTNVVSDLHHKIASDLSGTTREQQNQLMQTQRLRTEQSKVEFTKEKTLYQKMHAARISGQAITRGDLKRRGVLPGARAVGVGRTSWDDKPMRQIFAFQPNGLELPQTSRIATQYSIPSGMVVFIRDETTTSDLNLIESSKDIVFEQRLHDDSGYRDGDDELFTSGRYVMSPPVLRTYPGLSSGKTTAHWNLESAQYAIRILPGALSSLGSVRQPGGLLRSSDHVFEKDAVTHSLMNPTTGKTTTDQSKLTAESEMDAILNNNTHTNKNQLDGQREHYIMDDFFRNSVCWDPAIDEDTGGAILPDCILPDRHTMDIDLDMIIGRDLDLWSDVDLNGDEENKDIMMCTSKQILDVVRWINRYGDQVVTGVTMGCSATHTLEMEGSDIRGHGANDIQRSYEVLRALQTREFHNKKNYDDQDDEDDEEFDEGEDDGEDEENKIDREEDHERPSLYYDAAPTFMDAEGKKKVWIHGRRRRRLLSSSPLPLGTLPPHKRTASTVETIGGSTIHSNIDVASLHDPRLRSWLRTCLHAPSAIKQQLTPIETLLPSFHELIDDCSLANEQPCSAMVKDDDADTTKTTNQCRLQRQQAKKQMHREILGKNRELDDIYLDDIVQTTQGKVLLRKIRLIRSVRLWMGAKAEVLSRRMLDVEAGRRATMDADAALLEIMNKATKVASKIERHGTPFKHSVPGVVTSDALWHRIAVVAEDRGNGGGQDLVERYLSYIGNYKLFLYIRGEAAAELCRLRADVRVRKEILRGEHDNSPINNRNNMVDETSCWKTETSGSNEHLLTSTGSSGTERASFPSSAHEADDLHGLSILGLNDRERSGATQTLFSHAGGKSCDVCVSVSPLCF